MEKKETLYSLAALSVVILLIVSVILLSPQPVQNEGKIIVGKLSFPVDESAHKDALESWSVYLNGKGDDDRNYTIAMMWDEEDLNMQESRSFHIYLERDGQTLESIAYNSFRQNMESNKTLDLEWVSNRGGVMHFKRENPYAEMNEAEYSIQFINEDSDFQVDVNSFSSGNVSLLGLDGYAEMKVFGLMKGYIQANMNLSGSIFFNGNHIKLSGAAAYSHFWGYLPMDRMSFSSLLMKNRDHTVFLLRTYIQPTKLAWEYFYVISSDGYTVFMTDYTGTEGNKTVGASIDDQYRMKDLKGESYDAKILDYFLEPANPGSHRCYPDHWMLKSSYDRYSCICSPSDYSTIVTRAWEGFMSGMDNSNRTMWGFERIYTFYMSNMWVSNISFNNTSDSVDISALIHSSLPINQVVLNYSFNVSGIWEHGTGDMEYNKSTGRWYIKLAIPDNATQIRVKVHIQDLTYRWEATKLLEYEV